MRTLSTFLILFAVLTFEPRLVWAQPESTLKAILPYLQPTSAVVVKLDMGRIAVPDGESSISPDEETSKWIDSLKREINWLADATDGKAIYLLIDLPFSDAQPISRVFFEKSTDQNQQRLADALQRFDRNAPVPLGDLLTTSLDPVSRSLDPGTYSTKSPSISTKTLPVPMDRLMSGWKLIESYPVQIVIVPPDYLWQTYEELMSELPPQLGGGPVDRLTQGFRWAAFGLDPKSMKMWATIQSSSPAAAQAFASHLPTLISSLPDLLPEAQNKKLKIMANEQAKSLKTEVVDDRILLSNEPLSDAESPSVRLANWARMLNESLFKQVLRNNFRTLALAIHNYESACGSFPPAAKFRDEDGRSGLSWRVHILPFMEQQELFSQFKLDQRWDSPHNIKLLEKMPSVFRTDSSSLDQPGSEIPEGHTTLVAPVGEGTIAGGATAVGFGKITDGTSNTIMLVEVKPEYAVPWTAPNDYEFDPKAPAEGLKIGADGKFFAAIADGSSVLIRGDLPAESIKYLFQMNDGHLVDWNQ